MQKHPSFFREPRSVKQMCRGHVCSVGCACLNRHRYASKQVQRYGQGTPYVGSLRPNFVWSTLLRFLESQEVSHSAECDQRLCLWTLPAFEKAGSKLYLLTPIQRKVYIFVRKYYFAAGSSFSRTPFSPAARPAIP